MMAEQSRPEYDLFVSYAPADQEWVRGYLLDALEQAGANVLSEEAFRLGAPRLAEFERAVKDSARILLVLSPAYLADGSVQFVDLLAQSYGQETATWPVIPLVLQPCDPPARLKMLTGLDATDPKAWPGVLARLCAELRRPAPAVAPLPECPYPGMVPFAEQDAYRFFGRDAEVEQMLKALRKHPFLAVIGPSGSGKSSVVLAGLIPALRHSRLFGPGEWVVRAMRPGADPMVALQQAVGDLVNFSSPLVQPTPGPLQTADCKLLLVVDQLEELFAGEARKQCEPFSEALLGLAQIPRCYVILTVRADFYHELMASPLWREVQAHRREVLPLDEDGLRLALVRPAGGAGVYVDAALVERLVREAAGEPGILPFVQETLVLLWEKVERRYLPLSAYAALVLSSETGSAPPVTGLQVAMAGHADAVLAALPPVEQGLARRIFLRLVQFGEGRADTRRQQPVEALRAVGDGPQAFDRTLEHLAAGRLLTLSGEETGEGRRADIAHEALIRGWPALQGWLGERRGAEATRRRLEAKAEEWLRLGRGAGGLLDEVELAEAERWLDSPDALELGASLDLQALAQASRAEIDRQRREEQRAQQERLAQAEALAEEQKRRADAEQQRADVERRRAGEQSRSARRLRRRAAGLAAVFVLALVAAGVAGWLGRRAALQAQVATSRQLAAQAVDSLASQSIDLSLLLATESWRVMEEGSLGPILDVDDALRRTLAEAPKLIVRHPDGASLVAFSPDGRLFATGGAGTVRLWDAGTGQELAVYEHAQAMPPLGSSSDTVTALAFSPDATRLATGTDQSIIRLWTLGGSREPVELHEEFDPPVTRLAFSPNGRWLVAVYGPEFGTWRLRIWDISSGSEWSWPDQCPGIEDVAFSSDGARLALAAALGVCLLDAGTGEISAVLTTTYQYADTVQFSVDGKSLLVGGGGHSSVWDVATLIERAKWYDRWAQVFRQGRDGMWLRAFTLSPDAARLAILEEGVRLGPDGLPAGNLIEDYRVVLRDTQTGRDMAVLHHSSPVEGVEFSADGSRLVTWALDGTVRVWDAGLASEEAAFRHGYGLSGLAFTADGKRLASGGGYAVHVWEFAEPGGSLPLGTVLNSNTALPTFIPYRPILDLGTLRHLKPVAALAWSPDGSHLVTASYEPIVRLWDVRGGQEPLHPEDAKQTATLNLGDVAASPNGRLVAFYDVLKSDVVLHDAADGHTVSTLRHKGGVKDVAFAPDNVRVATASDDGTARLWNAESGTELVVLTHGESVEQVAWSPDGARLATRAARTVRIWDTSNGELLELFSGKRSYRAVAIDRQGRVLGVSAELGPGDNWNTIQVWDVARDRLLATVNLADTALEARFSSDGSLLATGCNDGTAGIWEATTGRSLAVLRHQNPVEDLAFSADAAWLATRTEDGAVHVWHVHDQDLAVRACQIGGRNLTLKEWQAYVGPGARYRCTCPDLPPGEGTGLKGCPAR